MATKLMSFRIPPETRAQLEALAALYGGNMTAALVVAVDRWYRYGQYEPDLAPQEDDHA